MRKYNYSNPSTHHGFLPIRVLSYNIIDWFEQATPDFLEELKFEVETCGLKWDIQYHLNKTSINEVSKIDPTRRIHLYENYNQFLWCVCYSLLVLFDEGIHKPILEKRFTGSFDLSDKFVAEGLATLKSGLSLFNNYDKKQ